MIPYIVGTSTNNFQNNPSIHTIVPTKECCLLPVFHQQPAHRPVIQIWSCLELKRRWHGIKAAVMSVTGICLPFFGRARGSYARTTTTIGCVFHVHGYRSEKLLNCCICHRNWIGSRYHSRCGDEYSNDESSSLTTWRDDNSVSVVSGVPVPRNERTVR